MLLGHAPALSITLAAAFVFLVQWLVGWPSVLSTFASAPPDAVGAVAGGLIGSYLLRTLRLRQALAGIGKAGATASTLPLLQCLLLNNAANWILPARTGDLGLPFLLRRTVGLELSSGVSVLLWLRLLDLQALATIGGLLLMLSTGPLGVAAGLALIVLAALLPAMLAWAASRWGQGLSRLDKVMQLLQRPAPAVALDQVLAIAAWAVKLLGLGFGFAVLSGLPVSLSVVSAIGGELSTVLPLHAPLGAGTYEAGMLAALSPWQHPTAGLLTAATALHLLMLSVALLCGAASLLWQRRRQRRASYRLEASR